MIDRPHSNRSYVKLVLALALAVTLAAPASAYETGGVMKTVLANGLTILVRPEPESAVVAIEVFVKVGAQNESPANAGIGQLLAASILAGTKTHSTVKLARLVSEVGGNFHAAWQWNYLEVYAVTVPAFCEETVSLLSDAVQNSRLDPAAVELSRSTVLNEMRRQADDPFNSAYAAVRRMVHRNTAYDRPFLGDEQSVRSITSKHLAAFYERNFTADKIVVSVVGNIDPQSVTRKIEVCFRNMKRSASVAADSGALTASSKGAVQQSIGSSASATYVMLGYPAAGVDDPDYPAMCVANVLLGGNKSSLLFAKLREERGLGYQVGTLYPALRGSSQIVAYLGMDSSRATPEIVEDVKKTMLDQVAALRSGKFSDEDLERAKRYLIGHHALDHQRTRDRAFNLGWAEAMGLGYQYDLQGVYPEKINRVTREDVLRVCARFLDEPRLVVLSGSSRLQGVRL
jgi:predicted Zn-dependent peptidase